MKDIQKRRVVDPLAIAVSWRAAMKAATLIGFLALFGMFEHVQANVNICNHTGSAFYVAIAYVVQDEPGTSTGGHRGVTTEGWWEVAPNQCAQVSNIDAGNHELYYRAKSETVSSNGRSLLCTQNKPFTLVQQFLIQGDRCPVGQQPEGFERIHATKKNHTLNVNFSGGQPEGKEASKPVIGSIGRISTRVTYNSPMIVAANSQTVMLDFCREWGSACGKAAADAFCQKKGHPDASQFQISEDIGYTAIISTGAICDDPSCDGFTMIECK